MPTWRRIVETHFVRASRTHFKPAVRSNSCDTRRREGFLDATGLTAMTSVIGIDLGTTNSVVAVAQRRRIVVIQNQEGGQTTPSTVAWTEQGEVLTGSLASRQAVINPENTIHSSKRFIGRRYDEVGHDRRRVSFNVVKAENGDAWFEVRGRQLAPPEVSARVLRKLRAAAEDYLGHDATDAVVSVPAYFNDAQRQATIDAAKIAGLTVRRIISEPTAAALAHRLARRTYAVIAVCDFGGGTFDASILEVGDNTVRVIATNGSTHLGGDDIDCMIMEWLIAEFNNDAGLDVSDNRPAIRRLREAAEQAKIELSVKQETVINLPFLAADCSGPKHLRKTLTRVQFENMVAPLVDRAMAAVRQALEDASRKPTDIDEVVLVGGCTRIPLVQQAVKGFFGRALHIGVSPEEVVAAGAAMQAGVFAGEHEDVRVLDVTPLTLGVETSGGLVTAMIPRNTTIPTQKRERFGPAGDDETVAEIHVLQGERSAAQENRSLARFHVENMSPLPGGVPKTVVTFDIDANGILSVTAKNPDTGEAHKLTVSNSGRLGDDEVARMLKEAAEEEQQGKVKVEAVTARNRLESLCNSVKQSATHNETIGKARLDALHAAVKLAEAVLAGESSGPEELESQFEQLRRAARNAVELTNGNDAPEPPTDPTANPGDAAPQKPNETVEPRFSPWSSQIRAPTQPSPTASQSGHDRAVEGLGREEMDELARALAELDAAEESTFRTQPNTGAAEISEQPERPAAPRSYRSSALEPSAEGAAHGPTVASSQQAHMSDWAIPDPLRASTPARSRSLRDADSGKLRPDGRRRSAVVSLVLTIFRFFARLLRSLFALPRPETPGLEEARKLFLDPQVEALLEQKKRAAGLIADEKRCARRVQNENSTSQEWERRAMMAVRAGDDSIATEARARAKEHATTAANLEKEWTARKAAADERKLELRNLNNRVEDAKQALQARAALIPIISSTLELGMTRGEVPLREYDHLQDSLRRWLQAASQAHLNPGAEATSATQDEK